MAWAFSDDYLLLKAVIDLKEEFDKDVATGTDLLLNQLDGKFRNGKIADHQVVSELMKLKKKYQKKVKKASSSASGLIFCTRYEADIFALCEKIWRKDDVTDVKDDKNIVKDDMMAVKDSKPKERKKKDIQQLYPYLIKSLGGEGFTTTLSPCNGLKTHLSEVDSEVLEEWDRESKQIFDAKLALLQKQIEWLRNHKKPS